MATRGPLKVTSEAVYWHGRKMPRPSPLRHALLRYLTDKGEATYLELEIGPLLESKIPVEVTVHLLRKWLRANCLPVGIQCLHGRGYRLEV